MSRSLGYVAPLPLILVTALVLAACGAVSSVVDDRSAGQVVDDNVIYAKISTTLSRESEADFADVSTNVFQGRVMLTGSVPDQTSFDTVAQTANAVVGVEEVINELMIVSAGEPATTPKDLALEGRLKAKLVAAKNIKSSNYRWKSSNGTIYLLGLAQNQEELDRILNVIKGTQGVDRVVSHVKLLRA